MSDFNSNDFFSGIDNEAPAEAPESDYILTEGVHNLKILKCEQKPTKSGHMLAMEIMSLTEGKRLFHNLIIDHHKTDVVARAQAALQTLMFHNGKVENHQGLVGFEFSGKVYTGKGTGQYGDSSSLDDRTIAKKDDSITEINSSAGSTSSTEGDEFFN